MRNRVLVVSGLVVVIAVVGFAMAQRSAPKQTDAPIVASPSVQPNASPLPLAAGAYVDYRAGIIEATNGTKILFFHAPWCPQCRKLEQSIKAGTIPDGVTIIKVDYDSNQTLRKQYEVTIQTSLVRVNDSGELTKRYVAYESPSLAAVIDNLLD